MAPRLVEPQALAGGSLQLAPSWRMSVLGRSPQLGRGDRPQFLCVSAHESKICMSLVLSAPQVPCRSAKEVELVQL